MKINATMNDLNTGNLNETGRFSIQFDGKMAHMLSTQIYSNAMAAAIREPICNALDASDEVYIQVPTKMDPTFAVEDKGPGMSHDMVMKLFSTYGWSDKDTSDEKTGGFGIGSKAPLAYVDTFNVESWQNGTKRTYFVYKGDDMVPRVSFVHGEDTERKNGVRISFSVPRNEMREFTDELHDVVDVCVPFPTLSDGYTPEKEVDKDTTVFEGDGWRLERHSIYGSRNRTKVIQQNVRYSVDSRNLEGFTREKRRIIEENSLTIYAPNGSVDPTPSREQLIYNEKTTQFLEDVITSIVESLLTETQKYISEAKTYWDACCNYKEYIETLPSSIAEMCKKATFNWNGEKVDDVVRLTRGKYDPEKLLLNQVVANTIYNKTVRVEKRMYPCTIPASNKYTAFIWQPKEMRTKHMVALNNCVQSLYPVDSGYKKRGRHWSTQETILILNCDEEVRDAVIEELGDPVWLDLRDYIPEKANMKRSRNTKKVFNIQVDVYGAIKLQESTWHTYNGGAVYVEMEHGSVKSRRDSRLLKHMGRQGVLPTVIGIPQSTKFKKDPEAGWIPLQEYALQQLMKVIGDHNNLIKLRRIYWCEQVRGTLSNLQGHPSQGCTPTNVRKLLDEKGLEVNYHLDLSTPFGRLYKRYQEGQDFMEEVVNGQNLKFWGEIWKVFWRNDAEEYDMMAVKEITQDLAIRSNVLYFSDTRYSEAERERTRKLWWCCHEVNRCYS